MARLDTVTVAMTQDELAVLPELPAAAIMEREHIIHGKRVTLPALPQMPWRLPDDPASITDEHGLA